MRPVIRRAAIPAVALSLLITACGGAGDEPEPAAPGPAVEDPPGEDVDELDEEQDEVPADDDPAPDEVSEEPDPDPVTAAPEPDPELLADPCGPHEHRTDEAFIELAAPVQDQVVSDELDIVGCSNVFEATVSYRLLDGDGATLVDGFTTATCGTGCVGEFQETVDLGPAAGEPVVYVQVFWVSPADDGGDEDLVEVMVVLE